MYQQIGERLVGKRVMDAGCGLGLGTARLAQAGALAIGVDKVGEHIDFARSCYPWLVFSKVDLALGVKFYPTFDAVVCIEVLEHLDDPYACIRTCVRNMKPGGRMWFSTPNARAFPGGHSGNPEHVREYTSEEASELLGVFGDVRVLNPWTLEPVRGGVVSDGTLTPLLYEVSTGRPGGEVRVA